MRERAQIVLRLPEELKNTLQKEAYEKGFSFNQYLLYLIECGRSAHR